MSDEIDPNSDYYYSTFWPLLILVSGLLVWFAVQDYELNAQGNAYERQFQDGQFQATVTQAENVATHYKALMSDLYQTAQKDPVAAQIIKDAIQAGMLHVQPNAANSAETPAEPTSMPR